MPWKFLEDVLAIVEGNPVWIDDDGNESPHDAGMARKKIAELNSESAGRRAKIKDLETAAKAFEDIEDVPEFLVQARKAIETVGDLDNKKLIDVGEAEKVRNEIKAALETRMESARVAQVAALDEARKEVAMLNTALDNEMIGGHFARSEFIRDQCVVPADIMRARFGAGFKRVDGEVVGFKSDGSEFWSTKDAGALAGFDEALSMMVDQYPGKDYLLAAEESKGADVEKGSRRAKITTNVIAAGDGQALVDNLEDVASGKVRVAAPNI